MHRPLPLVAATATLVLSAAPLAGQGPSSAPPGPAAVVAAAPAELTAVDTTSASTRGPAGTESSAPAKSPAPAPSTPAAVVVGVGSVKFAGTIQAWYMGGSSDVTNTFRIRRAELKFSGALNPRASWTLLVDLAKPLKVSGGNVNQGSLLLQDAYATLALGRVTLDVGQMKLPVSSEGSVIGSTVLETIDNALFIREAKLALVRDLGAAISGQVTPALRFKAGVFNGTGEGQNTTDLNDAKAAAGRVEWRTPVPGVRIAASGVWGGPVPDDSLRRDRVGVDAQLVRGPFTLRGEWMRGWDGATERLGYYGLGAYRIRSVSLVGRYDVLDRSVGAATAGMLERNYLAGLNYHVAGDNVRLQANYLVRTFGGSPHRELVLVNMQTAW